MPATPESRVLTTRFVPAAGPGGRLMVVLHGLGDSMAGFFWLPGELDLPGLSYLLVNAPLPYVIGYAWYDLEDPEPGVLHGRERLQTLFSELEAQGWAHEDVILFGFSQGGLMALDFALRFDRRLAGIVAVSGYVFWPETLEAEIHPRAREQAWLVTHGRQDELLPVARSREQVQRLQALGVPVEWHEFDKPHTIDPVRELPLIRRWCAARRP